MAGASGTPLTYHDPEPLATALKQPGRHLRLAECYMRANRLRHARRLYDQRMRSSKPDLGSEMLDGSIHVAQGDILREQGKITEAIAAYEPAIAAYSRMADRWKDADAVLQQPRSAFLVRAAARLQVTRSERQRPRTRERAPPRHSGTFCAPSADNAAPPHPPRGHDRLR